MAIVDFPAGHADLSLEEQAAVAATLRDVLHSAHFSKSRRCQSLLEFGVRAAFDQRSQSPKERTVGVEVFGKSTDYDTSHDPTVRIAAGEVRRRLALYFSEHPETPVRIDFPLGGYKAEFHVRAAETASANKMSLPSSSNTATPSALSQEEWGRPSRFQESGPGERQTWSRNRLALLATVLLAIVAMTGLGKYWYGRQHADFWSPALQGNGAVLVVAGQTTPSGWADPALTQAAAGLDNERPRLALDDAVVISQICGILREHKHECQIGAAQGYDLADLKGKSTVLVGGFNNVWTMRLLAPLRYSFRFDTKGKTRTLIEHTAMEDIVIGNLGEERPNSLRMRDYGIVARFRSGITGGMTVVVAGMGIPGSLAAAQFVASPDRIRALLATAPKDGSGDNVEAVLQIDGVQGDSPQIHVIRSTFW